MGKSIRSKIKRMHRAEFRRTIGTEAYAADMEKIQAKLKDCIEKQTLKSLDRLTDALDTRTDDNAMLEGDDDNSSKSIPAFDASETKEPSEIKGENKVIISKRSKRKQKHGYRMKAIPIERKHAPEKAVKPKPRFHCAF